MIGAAVGFLWFNAFPAEVFMGDTGAMALGGAIGAMAIFLQVPLLLLLVGGIFVIEALSVMIQVISFSYWGRRVFLMAPIHHHFEMKAWSETKIMVRFWIVAGILCAGGFALFYKYYPNIRPSDEGARLRARAVGDAAAGAARGARRRGRRASTARSATRTTSHCSTASTLLVKSPGVPGERPLVEEARRRGIPVWSEVELGWSLLAPAGTRFVGVTGTNGKTTTAELLGAIFRAEGREVARRRQRRHAAQLDRDGRLGRLRAVARSSSKTSMTFACEVAALLNLEPDHLDRHGSFDAYRAAKLRIFERAAGRRRPARARASRGSSSRPTTRFRPSR